ncbi:MAG: hypothetical protein OEN56_11480 [Gemmatimonadota bacterium]|nr:hypothetical protein [Gemmatimonadota bacterium]
MVRSRAFLGFTALVIFGVLPVEGQFDNVGSIDFPTSATGEAQQHFLRGVAILHSFGWNQAIEQFQAAQEVDPDFALAYWGESLSYNHPLVSQMDATEPSRVLKRLASTRAARLAKAPTDREKGLLDAVEILWGDGDHVARRVGYMDAMERLHDRYPDDSEIAAFYALSMLSAVTATGDLSGRLNIRAGTIALKLSQQNPDHPGAVHYTIHAFDDPLHAPLALAAAHRFADIAPAVSHARHMPTHIFIQHGMWDYVSNHNQSAYDAARDLWQPGQSMGDAIHALDWGQYGDLQLGDYEKARLWIERIDEMAEHGGFVEGGARGEAGVARAVSTNALLRARYTVETEEWSVGPISESETAPELLATGLSAARLGDQGPLREAEVELRRRVEGGDGGYTEVMSKQVSALLHAVMGHAEVATRFMDEAVALVDAMAPPRGAANPIKPVHELFGELLLELGQPARAAEMFETSLLRMPRRPRSVLGLARARVELGDDVAAADAYRSLTEIWVDRESFEGLHEARRFLGQTMNETR